MLFSLSTIDFIFSARPQKREGAHLTAPVNNDIF